MRKKVNLNYVKVHAPASCRHGVWFNIIVSSEARFAIATNHEDMNSIPSYVTVASRDAGVKPIGICSRRVTEVGIEFRSYH